MKILIIEKDAIVSILQKKWISKICKAPPLMFQNGLEAISFLELQALENPSEEFLIFLDLNMPGMNGWEFLDACEHRTSPNKISVVIVTSSKLDKDIKKAFNSPLIIEFLNKPLDAEGFSTILSKVQKFVTTKINS